MKSVVTQFVSFVAVGLTNGVVDLGVFNLIYALRPTANVTAILVYNSVAVFFAITNSYIWNSRWTFRSQIHYRGQRAWRQRVLFVLQSILNIGVNDLVLFIIVPYLMSTHGLSPRLASNISKVIAMVVASLVSFLAMRWVVFV